MASVDDLSRSEYPAMLANLQPSQAVQALSDRVKRITRANQEIADWLQERRRVEEQYVAGLRKLLVFKVPSAASELGIFQAPWDKILQSTDGIAASHQLFAQRIDKDVEQPLRNFQNKKEMQNMHTISANLNTMARELDDATDKSEKLSRKGGRANAQKVDQAASRLESASQTWESQAPFVFETLQALDEQRINHLRDVLTQFETHEVDQATRTQAAAEEVLNVMLEVNTSQEIQNFVQKTTAGKPKIERRSTTTRQQTPVTPTAAPPSITGDDISEHSAPRDNPPESKLRSRIGTMLGRRRQSIHGGFGQLGPPPKGLGAFSRGLGSSHSQTLSPRASSHNLADSQHRLPSVVESPTGEQGRKSNENEPTKKSHEGTNGVASGEASRDAQPAHSSLLNGTAEDIFDAPGAAPPSQPQQTKDEPGKDSDGFTIPPQMNDPISQAQREAAAEDGDHMFKLNIQNEPIPEEDQDAKQAALSSVANALNMGMPSRKTGTVRGRRDVRNTVYMPSLPTHEISSENPFPRSPSLPTSATMPKLPPSTTFTSETSHVSDTQSIRSGTSFGGTSSYSGVARLKHPDMHGSAYGPGLHSSIIETVSAVFQEGAPNSVKVTGEIALSYVPDPDSPFADHETIRLNKFSLLESIGPNRVFVTNTATPDEFSVDLSHLTTTTPAFTYRVHADSDTALASQCPIAIHPVWKPQADKLGLLLQYRLNPSCAFPRPVTLSNVVFMATYDGARASGVQTKPSGTHLKDKHMVYWRVGDLTLTDDWAKIICRVIGEQNAEPMPGKVEVRWEWAAPAAHGESTTEGGAGGGSGISVARLLPEAKGKGKAVEVDEDPFADVGSPPASPDFAAAQGRAWADVPVVRRLVGGKYESK
ncbi:Muniscin C-terminal mu homology domain-containing protein [Parachaetomium inaequale]|uniref:Muniscin C-terminal mu homology domain-containing protein n=1 Tax=Parachaetomium inaequale TaxID=2588326 RepID=A0AAN6PAH2_9PEZI|nr:Muniscin C-terminal mu homology domain-containing protein [Parachaetomium inaequale]